MQGQTMVAAYRSRAEAEQVCDELRGLGIAEGDVRLSADGGAPAADDLHIGPAGDDRANPLAPKREEGFFDWLFGSDVPERDRTWYGTALRDGRTAVSVRVPAGIDEARILQVMEAHDPLDIEGDAGFAAGEREEIVPPVGAAGDFAASQSGTAAAAEARLEAEAGDTRPLGVEQSRAPDASGDEVIPVVKEELAVGKRAHETRHRIRTYVVERPAEADVTLHDERVVIERRPVSDERAAEPGAIREREFEVVERREEPVVEKEARKVEELVVHKEARDRTERVRDKVRETRVEIDKAAAGNKPGTSDTPDRER
jgi:stress response protein YsnF